MSLIHRIKCGNGNCYIVENGTNGILVDTGKKAASCRVLDVFFAENGNITSRL